MNTRHIPIFFAADAAFFQHLCVAIVSILENNRHLSFTFHVLANAADRREFAKVESLKQNYDNFKLHFVEMEDRLFESLVLYSKHISRHTYYRYMIPTLFPEYDKVLYLDCDLIVKGNLEELWDVDISDDYAAGACDINVDQLDHKTWLGLARDETYINAGVLLLNTKKMREDRLVEKLFENTKIHSRVLRYQDQDVINLTMKKKIKVIDQKFNFLAARVQKNLDDPSILDRSVIVHYVGARKPWDNARGHDFYLKDLYFEYLKLTPYKKFRKHRRLRRFFHALKNTVFWVDESDNNVKVYFLGVRVLKKKIKNS